MERKVAAVADDDVSDDSDEEEISAEGVSDSDDDVDEQPATKRAKGNEWGLLLDLLLSLRFA